MGGERASTTGPRRAGRICCSCESVLSTPDRPGERYCTRCEAERATRRRVFMNFMSRDGWRCSFLEEDVKTSLPRKVLFATPEQMLAFAERGGCVMNLEDRQAFEHGIEIGRGRIWLSLTAEQYAKLKHGALNSATR